MEFCGYTRKESIVKLKEKDERDKMFTFVTSMSEVIEDKHAVFGVFSKCPDSCSNFSSSMHGHCLFHTYLSYFDANFRILALFTSMI